MRVLRCMRVVVTVLAFSLSFPAIAGPAEDAKAAYDGRDYATALRIWGALAEQGNPEAQAYLGIMYADGRGVTKDEAAAVQLFRKAAEQGHARGQNGLGVMYRDGRGVTKDDREAVQWFRTAANQGYAAAQTNLGLMYANGRGVTKDDAAAVQWYRSAADQGYAWGQNNLGVMYRDGRGIAKDDTTAVEWFRKAAVQGNDFAQTSLGAMYEAGRGVAKDDAVAVQWYRNAAEKGNARAQINLGLMYENGRGVEKDDAAAVRWYRKAADQGNDTARTNLERLSSQGPGVAKQRTEEVTATPNTTTGLNDARTRIAADSTPTITALIKKYEAAQPPMPVPDAERAALAREIGEATGTREKLSYLPARFNEGAGEQTAASKLAPKLREAIVATGLQSFRPDRIRVSWERWLAEALDAPTLRIGLRWERSELGRRVNRLELEAEAPEQYAAKKEFVVQFVKRGATADDSRGRACAQKDILDGSADTALPFLEALAATGAMVASVQQAPSPDMDMVERLVVALRPMLRDAARQASLAECLFTLRSLSDAEFDQVLDFLRTDAGGRYARGSNVAMRHALLEVTDVFTRTMVDVARQLKGGGET